MTEHSALPWFLGSNAASNYGSEIHSSATVKAKRVVCRNGGPDRDANAAFIVKACNSYEAMFEALREAQSQIVYMQSKFEPTGSGNTVLGRIRDALVLAATPAQSSKGE
ncbi:MAG: hypothetical protein JWQ94_3743 [Tardiphaga sp.]|nr:hypothetical protein [Tardiphaga sp.]